MLRTSEFKSRCARLLTLAVATTIAAMAGGGWASSARAGELPFDASGGTVAGTLVPDATGLDLSVSSAVTIGGSGITAADIGTTFTLLYQAVVTAVNKSVGNAVPPGLDTLADGVLTPGGYEMTVVGLLRETLVGFAPIGGGKVLAAFSLSTAPADIAASYFSIYFDDGTGGTVAADNITGAGFADGSLVLTSKQDPFSPNTSTFTDLGSNSADVDPLGPNYTGVSTINGSGNTSLRTLVVPGTVDPAFFPMGADTLIFDFDFGTLQETPFNTVAASGAFTDLGMAGPFPNYIPTLTAGDINGETPGDFIFEVDANTAFSLAAVPEPGTLFGAAMGIGLASLGALRTHRRRVRSETA